LSRDRMEFPFQEDNTRFKITVDPQQ
jgi:hypothetical protein